MRPTWRQSHVPPDFLPRVVVEHQRLRVHDELCDDVPWSPIREVGEAPLLVFVVVEVDDPIRFKVRMEDNVLQPPFAVGAHDLTPDAKVED